MSDKFIGVIPARRGSKGLPNKNILKINGKTLLYIAVSNALEAKNLDEVILTTDYDLEEVALGSFKFDSRFRYHARSKNTSGDDASTESVIIELADTMLGSNLKSLHVVLLQPTCPLRNASHIDSAIEIYKRSEKQGLISFVEVGDHHPSRMYRVIERSAHSYCESEIVSSRRQLLEKLFLRNGAIYIKNVTQILDGERFASSSVTPFIMDQEESINIDNELDYRYAKFLLENECNNTRTY